MTKLFLSLIALVILPAASAQDRVSLADGRVSFVLPPGFRAMTDAEIKFKFPRGNAPQYVYANERLNVSIAITFSPQALTPGRLSELKAAMEQMLPRTIPGLTWLTREIEEINGRDWVHFEMTSSAIDTDIHNEMLFTAFDGRMLGFNFNATVALHGQYKDALQKSRDSIRILP